MSDFVAQQQRSTRSRAGLPARRLGDVRIRRRLEECLEHLDPGHAIHHAVVGLHNESKRVVLEALNSPKLPKRPAAVDVMRKQAADQALEGALIPRKRQPGVSEVEPHVEAAGRRPKRGA